MPETPKIDIRPDHWLMVRDILQKHIPDYEVWAFGSRAKWTAKEYSDLDLAVITDQPLPLAVSAALSDDFSESDLPWRVDVVDWAATSESFRAIIEQNKVVIQNEKWQTIRLGNVCVKIGSVATPRGGKEAYKGGFTTFIRSQNIYNDGFSFNGLEFIDDQQASELKNVEVQENDVLLNITGDSVARCCSIDPTTLPARVNQHVAIIRPDPEALDAKFLRYVMVSPWMQSHLLALASTGATRNALTKSMIENLQIKAPRLAKQKAIAQVLSTLDDKIHLNRSINQTLEQMAQAIFKSWFVDFDPVKAKIAAKQEGRDPLRAAMCVISGKTDDELNSLKNQKNVGWVSPKQSEGRNPTIEADALGYGYRLTQPTPDSFSAYDQLAAVAELFPDEMEESELGAIPKGWRVCPMPDCIEVNPMRQLKKGTSAPYLDMANVPTNSARAENEILREFTSGSKFVNGDTLLARNTPCLENGKTAYVDFLDEGQTGWGSTEFIVLRSKPHLPLEFCYFLCRHPEFRSFAIAQMAGTSGRQRVPNDCFSNFRLVEPSKAVAAVFGSHASELMNEIKALDEVSRSLSILRDTLLPKLLSGEMPLFAKSSSDDAGA